MALASRILLYLILAVAQYCVIALLFFVPGKIDATRLSMILGGQFVATAAASLHGALALWRQGKPHSIRKIFTTTPMFILLVLLAVTIVISLGVDWTIAK